MDITDKTYERLNRVAYRIEQWGTYGLALCLLLLAVPYLLWGLWTLDPAKVIGGAAFTLFAWVLYRVRRKEDIEEKLTDKWRERYADYDEEGDL